jgi:hypothetical protein
MTNLTELGLTTEEVEKIRMICRLFQAQRVTVIDKIIVDKQTIKVYTPDNQGG